MYIPRKYRNHNLVYILMALELPLIVALLTLTGIAAHDRYQSKLWEDGYENGFNSSPKLAIYAAANYRSYSTPKVWDSFTTNWNLVISILSTFILITKFPLHILQLLYPIVSTIIHMGLVAVYCVSAAFQTGSDKSDPDHLQSGPPWYITKNCNVAHDKGNVGYCQQAKSLFAVTIIIIVLYAVELGVAAQNCFITKEEREERDEKREEKETMKAYEDMILKSPSMIPMTPSAMPMTPGTATYPRSPMPVMTPRSLAFNRVDSPSTDLPLREHFSSPTPPQSVQQEVEASASGSIQPAQPQIYFPPPPKKAKK
ncbi:uncharacterized protein BJX67DRAFT_328710 [Aspergillus lucknowensis]|uniref:MARVEL domain-containing protein n=1 Tax=Aspergillus lucknowensis TaxID=176173 RepID=A0ABR4L870_9EURO